MIIKIVTLAVGVLLAGCTSSQVEKIQRASANFQASVASINAGIAAVAPTVAARCADAQKYVMLIGPFVPDKPKAKAAFEAGNAALVAYCQDVPTDIASTAAAVARAVAAARAAYDDARAGT